MTQDHAEFQDAEGRGWTARILWGHPSPAELGIHAVRFDPVGHEAPVRVGFAERYAVEAGDVGPLREALAEAEPAREIG
jgi:hypothetical protein